MRENSRIDGAMAEAAVASFLERNGFSIEERNYYSRYGELDIVARCEGLLVFIEVKYRRSGRFSAPAEAVTRSKQAKLVKTAGVYMAEKGIEDIPVRFDVAEVLGEEMEIRIIEDAFTADLGRYNPYGQGGF